VASLKRESAAHRGDGGDAPEIDQFGPVDPANSAFTGHPQEDALVDPRRAWLLRAWSKQHLVDEGLEDIDTAIADLADALRAFTAPCECERQTLAAWERGDIEIRQRQRRS
jgi:hypothetical protein